MLKRLFGSDDLISPTLSGNLSERCESIPDEKTLVPNMPVGVFAQEAYSIYKYAMADRTTLERVGLDWRMVQELPARIDLLREREADWWEARFTREFEEIEHEKAILRGDAIREKLLRDIKFALHGEDKFDEIIEKLKESEDLAEYLIEFRAVEFLAEKNKDLLKTVGADLALIDELREVQQDLRTYHLGAITKGQNDRRRKCSRNKAYTFLRAALEELRRCAEHALWDNPERLKGYQSQYFKRSSSRPRPRKKRDQV